MLIVKQVIKCYSENTATSPFFCVLSNGDYAILKYPNNPEGNLILINEFISYKLAEILGLDTPGYGICEFTPECSIPSNINVSDSNYGLCFYSKFINKAVPFSPSKISSVVNKEQFNKLIIFDHLIYNKDRHEGNILITISKDIKMLAIDHSHVFKNQSIWDKNTFIQGMKNSDYLDTDILEYNDYTYKSLFEIINFNNENTHRFTRLIKLNLTESIINDIISSLPSSWIKYVDELDIKYLIKYLIYRVEHIDETVSMIIEERKRLR